MEHKSAEYQILWIPSDVPCVGQHWRP